MTLPTSATWDLADFSGIDLSTLLTLGPGDLSATPSIAPYFTYNAGLTVLQCRSSNSIEASLQFDVALPGRFTIDLIVRFPALPNNLGDLGLRKCGLTLADSGGRGFTLYFAKTGLAVSRVGSLGSSSALPDTADVTAEVSTQYHTIRIAVDGGLGRAYVFVGIGATEQPALRWIVPVEATPPGVTDLFRLFVQGTGFEPVDVEITSLRLASDLVIANYPPIADAGPDRVAPVGQAARLDGRASYDLESAPLEYKWRLVDAPFGSDFSAEISSVTTTDDGDADGATTLISTDPSKLPDWLGVGDIVRVQGQLYEIVTVNTMTGDIVVSLDAVPDDLVAGTPARFMRQSILLNNTSETPTVVADVAGLYRFDLVVNDGESASEPAEVLLNVTAARAPFGVEPDVSPLWKAIGDEWKYIEDRQIFEEAWRGAAQILSGKMLEAWQYHYNSSIRDAQKIFQRKWVAYRTLEAETAPDDVVYGPRWGAKTAAHPFETGNPAVTGLQLKIDFSVPGSLSLSTRTVTFSGSVLSTLLSEINAAMVGSGFTGIARSTPLMTDTVDYRHSGNCSTTDDGDADGYTAVLSTTPSSLPSWIAANDIVVVAGVRSRVLSFNNGAGTVTIVSEDLPDDFSNEPFRIYRACRLTISARQYFVLSGTALALLGFDSTPNYLKGISGARVTDTVYHSSAFVDLGDQGVVRNDLLVLNNGESFRIDRVVSDALDPFPNQRVLVFDTLPIDASATWAIPSVVRSASVDYEVAGTYPGDLVKIEVYDTQKDTTTFSSSKVVAQKGTQIAADLDAVAAAAQMDSVRWDSRLLGVRRRKAIPLPADVISIPQLQTKIPVASTPTIYKENVDYILEPFYRELGGAAIPMLQFTDAVFIDTNTEPPDVLWAELTLFSNEENVENLFGRLVGFLRDDAASFSSDFNYVAGVAGLLYAQQRGPNIFSVQVGAQILLGQPFAEVAGYIEEIRGDYSPTTGRVLVRDDDGNVPTESEVVRAYYYKKDPRDLGALSGLALNPETNQQWVAGEKVPQFSPLGAGIDVYDLYNNPTWWIPFVRSGGMTEIEKFHRFLVQFNADLVSIANIELLFSFVSKIKPRYTSLILGGVRSTDDDLDPTDDLSANLEMHLNESLSTLVTAFMYDDYRGDGTTSSLYDDGDTHYDGLVDSPTDLLDLELTFTWGGGMITEDLPYGDTIDVDGAETGTPGMVFTSSLNMDLAAGDYVIIVAAKDQGIIYP